MRIRTVKPEFFTHETIFDVEQRIGMPARIAFIGLWCAADREGRFKWEPRRLKLAILPYDECDFSEIMDALAESGLLEKYGDFGFIPSFLKHQCINTREAQSSLPDPCTFMHVHAREKHEPRVSANISKPVRDIIFERDENKCVRCGNIKHLAVDHIFPRCIGGTHAISNLRILCRSCNSARPTQGKALIDDLALDGFTMDDMQRICMHVHAQGERKGMEGNKEGKGKEPSPATADESDFFAETEITPKKETASSEGITFAHWFRDTLSEKTNMPDRWEKSFAQTYDDLVRLDGRNDAEIRRVCQWARTDSFWASNFQSPSKLRKRNNDGIQYYDVFLEKAHQVKRTVQKGMVENIPIKML